MEYSITLKMFQDDADREYGLAPKQCLNSFNDLSFNAFWSVIGIFHDVFEHWFEDNHKYFNYKYSMNILGEAAAMGSMLYYMEIFPRRYRELTSNNYPSQMAFDTISGDIINSVKYDGYSYNNIFECCIPNQDISSTNSYYLDDYISNFEFMIKELKQWYKDGGTISEHGKLVLDSLKISKFKNAAVYGYKLAKKIVPYTEENYETLDLFFDKFKKWTTTYQANEFADLLDSVVFDVRTRNKKLSFDITFISTEGFEYKTNSKKLILPDPDDLFVYED